MRAAPLVELCEINVGRTPARAEPSYWGKGHRWLSIADMNQGLTIRDTKEQITDAGARAGKVVAPGTVLLSFKLSIGKVGIAEVPIYTNEAIAALPIKDHSRLDERYLMRALQAMDLSGGSNRAAMGATLNKKSLAQVSVPLTSIGDQRRIVRILDHADAIRTKRRQILTHLDALTQSIFHDMFGDPDTWRDRWPMGVIGDMAESVQYGTSAKAGSSGQWPILRMGNVTDSGRLDLTDLKHIDLSSSDVPKYSVRRGDMLFNRTNSKEKVGKTAVVHTDEPLALAGYLVRVRFKPEHRAEFVSAYMTSRHGLAVRQRLAKAAVNQANINATEMRAIAIAMPPTALQTEFAERLADVEAQRAAVMRALATDAELLASLQSRAFEGEL